MTEFLTLHARTPAVTVSGSVGTPARTLAFLRHPDEAGTPARILATRTLTAPLTRTVRAFGARPLDNAGTGSADAVTVITLSGQPLLLHTADGDITLTLSDAAGRPLWGLSPQGTAGRVDYEPDDGAGRPLALTEQPAGGSSRMREQYAYAAFSDSALKACNLAGALTEHRHNAGISRPLSLSVTGLVLLSEERLLTPEAELPDWSVLTEGDTEDALMMSGTGDATGAPLAQMNAAGVTTLSAYDISGTVRETRLTYTEGGDVRETVTLRDILYRADGVVLSQTAGNGVTDTYVYDPRTQRLVRHTTQRPAGHPLGALVISDLHYTYDPAGNILTLDDRGADPAWHNNQQTTGLRTYAYDTLYRLTSATGRERHPVNPDDPTAGQVWSPYTQVYSYDDGDNLTRTVHTGGSGNRTVEMEVSAGSNRAIRKPDGGTTPDPEAGFLAGGLQKALSDGRLLTWHADGQLELVSPVVRAEGETDDTEAYRYSDGGTRVRKIRTTQTSGGTQLAVTTYAGGYELRRRSLAGTLQRDIVITDAGGVRLTEDRLTGETRLRYALTDHLNSQGGEADDSGRLTSREEYLPYGGSAGSDEEAAEIHDRTQRYSGKERDATGLLYYGWRYYQPDAGRWLSADPGGLVDGVNLFRFCRDNPIQYNDKQGLSPEDIKGDDYTLEHFFNELKANGYIEIRKELAEKSSQFAVGKLKIPKPFAKKEIIFDSVESVEKVDYPMVDGKLYRAHYGSTARISREGVLRNVDNEVQSEQFDDYLIKLFKHTAGHGSEGKVMSLSANRNKSKKFMSEDKTLVTIDINLYEDNTKKLFISTPQLILQHGARLYRDGKIDLDTLDGAITQLNSKEHEFFFIGKTEGLRYGEIAPDKLLSPQLTQSETGTSFIRWLSLRNQRHTHGLPSK